LRKSGFNRDRQICHGHPIEVSVSRRLRAYVAILVGALAAGVPVALLLRGLDNYIEREARDEASARGAAYRRARRMAHRPVDRGARDDREGWARDLRRRRARPRAPRGHEHHPDQAGPRSSMRPAIRNACCRSAAKAHALSRELRTADDRVFPERHPRRTGRPRAAPHLAPRRRSAAPDGGRFRSTSFLPDGASNTAASNPVVRIMLNEGTLIAGARRHADGARADADSIQSRTARRAIR
jgi:hypothetical protein